MFTLRSPALRQKSRVGNFEETRDGDVHMYNFEDAPATATNGDHTTSSVRQLSHEDETKQLMCEKQQIGEKTAADCCHTSCWPCHDPIFYYSKLVHCAAWTHSVNQTTGERSCCTVQVTLKEILGQDAHFLHKDVTSWCRTFCPLLRNAMVWISESAQRQPASGQGRRALSSLA